MEHDSEPLDWGNEDEEQKEAYRRASLDYATMQANAGDDEGGAEDTISLGDEDEDGYYFQREVPNRYEDNANSSNTADESFERFQSPQRRADSLGANEESGYQLDSRDRDNYERASPSTYNMPLDTPPIERDQDGSSKHQTSPSQTTITRLKHALPPKPIPAKVPYLPPSHPSIVSATSMIDAPANGTTSGKAVSLPASNDLPHPWVMRRARGGGDYYYNTITEEASWYHPVSNVHSSRSGQFRRRTHSGSSNDTYMTPSDSNIPQSQTSRSRSGPDISRGRPDHDEEIAASDRQRMTYTDRHYRPGVQPTTATAPVAREIHPTGHTDVARDQHPSRSRYDRSPPPSSPRQRRRVRSISPPVIRPPPSHSRNAEYTPPRESHLDHRERHGYTNAIPPVSQREADMSRDRWVHSHLPPTEYDRSDRVPHKPPHRQVNADGRDYEHPSHDEPRLYVRRRESSRGPPRDRDREPPRFSEGQEYSTTNTGYQSASRSYVRDREPARDYPPPPVREISGLPYPERKERAPPFNRSASSNGPPPNVDREPYNSRPREHDERPPPTYDHRRNNDRDFDRPRRDVPPPDAYPPPRRHPNEYPPPREIIPPPTTTKASRYPDQYDRPLAEDSAQLSHRRRQPLPPQATTYMSAPTESDPPPHAPPPPQPEAPKPKPPGWANFDPTLPRRPRLETKGYSTMKEVQQLSAIERYKRDAEERGRPFREKAQADIERSRAAMEAMAQSVPKPLNTSMPKPPTVPTPVYDHDRRNGAPKPQEREFIQRPPRLDTRMDMDPRDAVDTRRPASPHGMRSARPRQDEEDRHPGGPRSARSAQTPTERPTYPPTSVVPPPNARYESGFSAGLPPREANTADDRRFNEHRPEWRDNRSNDVFQERGPVPPRRDFRSRSAENDLPPSAIFGTNNVPIGARRSIPTGPPPFPPPPPPNGVLHGPPQAFGFNPDARPPLSTLIRPLSTSDLKRGPESYNRPYNAPAEDEPRKNGPPPLAAQQNSAPKPAVNQQAMLPVEGDKTKRRVSRFSPLISKPETSQEQNTQQQAARRTSEEKQTLQTDISQPSQTRRTPQSDARSRDAGPVPREDQPASRFADNAANPTRAEPSQNVSSEPTPIQRSRYRWSEQMANAAAPDSPEATVEQKPPRHRKYTARHIASEDNSMAVDASPSNHQNGQPDGTLSFMERLEHPSNSKRNSTAITLLDRLSYVQDSSQVSPESPEAPTPSLRDRLVPSKRDRDGMMDAVEPGGQVYDGEEGNDSKRMKRRISKVKRGGKR